MVQVTDSDQHSTSSSSDSSDKTASEEEYQHRKEQFKAKLGKKLKKYERAKKRGDDAKAKTLLEEILAEMRDFAETSPNAEDSAYWRSKADALEKASESGDKESANILADIGMGLGIIVASPFLLAGGVLYGVGRWTKGLGNLLTGGSAGRMFE
ncbi:hypothetical protein C8R43DRAFT_494761 [Mycena crocata]|nr:hypothetical protein C8R43DRAFT_494761 [Mycena crocata]